MRRGLLRKLPRTESAGRRRPRSQSSVTLPSLLRLAPMSRFLDRLAAGLPIVADGGMGALLASAVSRLRCPEEANLRAPDSVIDVHLGYIRAGADLIETNTFGANRPKLAHHFLEDEFERDQRAGVRLAREAREVSGRDVFIAGSIGPLGDVELRDVDAAALFAEQAACSRAAASTSSWSRRSSTSAISRRRSARSARSPRFRSSPS